MVNYCHKIKDKITQFDARIESVQIFDSNDIFNSRIRDADMRLFNYVLIVGKKEITENSVRLRIINHTRKDQSVSLDEIPKIISDSYFLKPNSA
jgi:threonyl-tRNA synthetase